MKKVFLICVFALGFVGCSISADKPNRVILKDDKVIIDDGGKKSNGNNGRGYHCPPGQAKKGNC